MEKNYFFKFKFRTFSNMTKIKKTVLLILTTILLSNAMQIDDDDEIASIEVEEDNLIDNTFTETKSKRNGRILWPYPVVAEKIFANEKEINITKEIDNGNSKDKRQKRFLYPQGPIMDMMLQTMSLHPKNNNDDLFDILKDPYPLPKGYSEPLDEYDYVIVGAGSAGSVLAARLTEDKPRAMVLVLEAGQPEMLLSDVPALAPYLQLSDYTWQYSAEYDPDVCWGSVDHRCFLPRGRAVGGTSVTNNMIYTRGQSQDWNRIAADGNYGWSYDEILPYYMKSQRAELKHYKYEPYQGQYGELVVENPPFRTRLIEAFLEAGRINGNPTVDYNAPNSLGFGYLQTTTIKGHRMSAAKAFLHPHKRRRNLHILPGARATKILIEPQSKRAYAVEYYKNGIKRTVRCRREIILSAGPIASPQLLMLSGLGPKAHLEKHGIPVIHDLPVGRNLYDHITFPGVVFTLNQTNISFLENRVATLQNLIQWLQFGEGLLASPGSIEGIGYIKTSQSEDPEPIPDIELISFAGSIALDAGGIFRQSLKINDETYYSAFGALSGIDTWSAAPMLLHPKSKGYLKLRDNNPFSPPKLYAKYFSDPKDIVTMIEAIRYIIRLGESEPFRKFGAKLHFAEYPRCKTYALGSDAYWECALRTLVVSAHHQIATCRMGPPQDPEAVVDPELRVYGVDGLRVVDSSVIPRTIGAHTNAPEIMIGEKAADMIKKTWANIL